MTNDPKNLIVPTIAGLTTEQTAQAALGDVEIWNADHKQWLADNPNTLREIRVQKVNDKDLTGANLDWVKLGGLSDFSGNTMDNVQMNHGIYRMVNFSDCEMNNLTMQHSNAGSSNFMKSRMESPDFMDTDLSMSTFGSAMLINPKLKDAQNLYLTDFTGATITGLDMSNKGARAFSTIKFNLATLTEAKLSNSTFYHCNFNEANLDGADFSNSKIPTSSFFKASLRNANFTKGHDSVIGNASFIEADLRGANFSGHAPRDFNRGFFERAKYDDTTIFPEGVDPEALGMKKIALGNEPVIIDSTIVDKKPARISVTETPAKTRAPIIIDAKPVDEKPKQVAVTESPAAVVAEESMFGVKDNTPDAYKKAGFSDIQVMPDWASLVEEKPKNRQR